MYGPIFDSKIREWKKLHNDELQQQFQRPYLVKEITMRRLMQAGHPWCKQESQVKCIIKEDPL